MDKARKAEIVENALHALRDHAGLELVEHSQILAYIAQGESKWWLKPWFCRVTDLQGCYVESTSTQHQLQTISDNVTLMLHLGALNSFTTYLGSILQEREGTSKVEQGRHEEIVKNICTALYFLLATSNRAQLHQNMNCVNLSLIVVLIRTISRLCDVQDAWLCGMTIRQAVLLLRQAILATLGGSKDIQRCKRYRRVLADLPEVVDKVSITTTPLDYANFRSELISKYPSYTPPPLPAAEPDESVKLSRASRSTYLELPIYTEGQWTATPAPSPPPSPRGKKSMYTTDQTIPFLLPLHESMLNRVPCSIEEAAALFESRQKTNVSSMELWQEQEEFVRSERGWVSDKDLSARDLPSTLAEHDIDNEAESLQLQIVEDIYQNALPYLQSCIVGLVSHVWHVSSHNLPAAGLQAEKDIDPKIEESVANTRGWLFNDKVSTTSTLHDQNGKSVRENEECRDMEVTFKGVSGSLILLLKWFKVSHILKFEYLSQLLIDADWIHTFHQAIMSLNPVVGIHVSHEDSRRSYFAVCSSLSEVNTPDLDDYDSDADSTSESDSEAVQANSIRDSGSKASGHDDSATVRYNWKTFFNTINFLAITQKLVKKKTHRNSLLVQAKTWLHLRRPLRIPHDLLQLYCLKLYKGQVPLCSRKWRTGNMKVITQIYMSCRPELREDWIAGTDVDTDLEEAKHQEAAIRALILFYNTRRYPAQMADLGFTADPSSDSDDDFFQNEVARLR